MAHRKSTWLVSLRLVANFAPWLIVLQSAWGIVKQGWSTGSVSESLVVKMVFFALVGILVTWRLPPYDAAAGLGPNISWSLRLLVSVGLWVAVIDRIWIIASTIWARNAIGITFIAYTIVVALIAMFVNWKWMPRDVFQVFK